MAWNNIVLINNRLFQLPLNLCEKSFVYYLEYESYTISKIHINLFFAKKVTLLKLNFPRELISWDIFFKVLLLPLWRTTPLGKNLFHIVQNHKKDPTNENCYHNNGSTKSCCLWKYFPPLTFKWLPHFKLANEAF